MQQTDGLRSGAEQIAEQLTKRALDRSLAATVLSTAADADGLTAERLAAMLAHTEGVDEARFEVAGAAAGGNEGLRDFALAMAARYADQSTNGLAFAGALRSAGGADATPEMARLADALQLTPEGARAIVLGDTGNLSVAQQSTLQDMFAKAGVSPVSTSAESWQRTATASTVWGSIGSAAGEMASYVAALHPGAGAAVGGVAMLATAADQLPEIKSAIDRLSGLVDIDQLRAVGGHALPGIESDVVRKPLQEAMEAVLKVANKFEDRLVGMLERSPNGLLRAAGIGAKQLLDGAKATGYFGEQVASFVLDHSGLFEAGSVRAMQNPSMHGIDIMAKALTGAKTAGHWVGFEVKASTGQRISATSYSERQQWGADSFIRSSLERAAGPGPWWRKDQGVTEFARDVIRSQGRSPFYGVAIEFSKVNSNQPTVHIVDWPKK